MMMPAVELGTIQHLKRVAHLRAAKTALALERFEGTNNCFPPSLDELVPGYMETLPLDPFGERPMGYTSNPEKGWTLSSRGYGGKLIKWPE